MILWRRKKENFSVNRLSQLLILHRFCCDTSLRMSVIGHSQLFEAPKGLGKPRAESSIHQHGPMNA